MKTVKRIKLLVYSSIFLVLFATTMFITMHRLIEQGFIHLSFDDCITVFEDITINYDKYDSIFENEFLSYLKHMHDQYGAVFSLYCYYENNNFNLSQSTDKFANEFNCNADWLKFGYHAMNSEESMAEISASEAMVKYEKMINELIRITGGTNTLDTAPRLHYFAGNESALIAISKTRNGSNGFLTADDERDSYYLIGDKNKYIDNHDFFEDDNGIWFVSTDLRLENNLNPFFSLMKIANDQNQNNCIEVFTHEWKFDWITRLKIQVVCFFAFIEGYSWDYPMNNYGGEPCVLHNPIGY